MSDTPTAGEAATKTRMLNSFLDNVKTNIQNSIVWDTGNRPADGTTQTMQSAVPGAITTASPGGSISTVALGSGTLGAPGTDKVTDSVITAAQLATVLVNYTSIWTSIRKVNLKVYIDNSTLISDDTQITHLSSNGYEQSNTLSSLAVADDVESDEIIDASNFNDFTAALYSQWNTLKNNTIYVQEYFCHSSCHSSCHYSCHFACFIRGTQIRMNDQSVKNIEDIVVDDKLLRLDGGTNKVLKLQENIFTGGRKLGSINNGPYFFTEDHPINTTNGWKSLNASMSKEKYKHILDVTELKVGDIILGHNGENTEIETINLKEVDSNTPIYNFELDGDHLYFANDFCVHNKCFKSNIEVLLADGSAKQISEIIIGDVLIGGNGEPNTVTKDDSISIGSYGRQPNWYGFNGKEKMITAEHPLMTQDGWKAIDPKEIKRLKILPGVRVTKLKIGDTIQGYDSTFTIESIEKYKAQSKEIGYNFGLDGDHTYYVKVPKTDNWLLAHNRSCFVAGTVVTMADGTEKKMEDVNVGEVLLGQDGSHNEVLKQDFWPLDGRQLVDINNSGPWMTPEHPLWTRDGWKAYRMADTIKTYPYMKDLMVGDLDIGDEILNVDGKWIEIKSMKVFDNKPEQTVYNFHVSGNNTYYANGLLAHNRE